MKTNTPLIIAALFALVFSSWFFTGCKDNPAGSHADVVTVTADTSVVAKLGITTRPIVDSTARLIAESASTGKTISSSQHTTADIGYFDVQELVGVLTIDVNVRTSDGAIITFSDPDIHWQH
ncbi:MAG: hypothetical protein JSS75_04020 [Bacteroidetes bacterium]|nr:hypothetical protein [Bacteroidota bacterium]